MQTATDKIQLFTPPMIAEQIGGNAQHVMLVLQAVHAKGDSSAFEWMMVGDRSEPWKYVDPGARGDVLVDRWTEELCVDMHQLVVATNPDTGTISREAAIAAVRQVYLKKPKFDALQFRRAEIARWLVAYGLHSAYDFVAGQTVAQSQVHSAGDVHRRRYTACIDAGLKLPKNSAGRLPDGIGELAKKENISKPAFAKSVKKHIEYLSTKR